MYLAYMAQIAVADTVQIELVFGNVVVVFFFLMETADDPEKSLSAQGREPTTDSI